MWLLDANIDVHLASFLNEQGFPVENTKSRNWQALSNGDLVSVAVEAGFTCVLTQDRLFAESAAKALKKFPTFAVVVIRLPQLPWKKYLESFQSHWKKFPIKPKAGQIISWP
jgi:predicted nuclease of predicted toxin-antitoxin system